MTKFFEKKIHFFFIFISFGVFFSRISIKNKTDNKQNNIYMEKLLSIVIPVYKVEKFIDKCISSLLVPDKQKEHYMERSIVTIH